MKSKIAELLANQIPSLTKDEIEQFIEIPPKKEMGDFAFPCFRLSKVLRKAPPVIASELKEVIGDQPFLSEVKVIGAYLNFYINKEQYTRQVIEKYTSSQNYGFSDEGHGKNVCLDYSSPNVAKNFHVGHLRTTIIGNSLSKIYTKLGYHAVRINHLGDWGTQFGKLIVAYKKWGSKEAVEENGIQELMDIYVRFHEEAEKDPSLDDEARAWFVKMERGDEEALEIWEWFKDISLNEFLKVYKILGMEFDYFTGESFYRDKTSVVIEKLTELGLLEESQGAMVVNLNSEDMPPCIVCKTDGSSIYATRDLAAILYRKETFDFDRCLYVTGLEQKLHFAQVFKVIGMMGNDYADRLIHIPYGLVSLKNGKISSRKGNVIFAEDILKESIGKTRSIIEEKNPNIPDKEKVAQQIGIGAIIFNDLYNQRIKDVIFDWEKLLNFDGETGPYVQYTYARASSVIRKAGSCNFDTIDYSIITDEASVDLLKEVDRYPQMIKDAADRYEPSVIARYCIDVAHAFNKFYHDCQINVDNEALKNARLCLVSISRYILKDALSLLGIECPEQM